MAISLFFLSLNLRLANTDAFRHGLGGTLIANEPRGHPREGRYPKAGFHFLPDGGRIEWQGLSLAISMKRVTAEKRNKQGRSSKGIENGTLLTDPEIVIVQRAAVRAADKLAQGWKAARTPRREMESRLKAATQCFGMLAEMRLQHLDVSTSPRTRRVKQGNSAS